MSDFLGDELLEALKGIGASFPDPEAALLLIEVFLDQAADVRASDALGRVRELLGDTPHGLALDRVLFGPSSSLRKAAKSVGVSHVGLAKSEAKVRAQLPPELQFRS